MNKQTEEGYKHLQIILGFQDVCKLAHMDGECDEEETLVDAMGIAMDFLGDAFALTPLRFSVDDAFMDAEDIFVSVNAKQEGIYDL